MLIMLLIFAATLTSYKLAVEEYSHSETIALKNTKNLKADFKINAGTFHLTTHSESSASFKSTYTNSKWKPEVQVDAQSGKLKIHQAEEKNFNMEDEDKNDWSIKIPKMLNTDLLVRMGAGEGIMDLSGSKLNTMELRAGAGNFDLNLANTSLSILKVGAGVGAISVDLSGNQNKNLSATIDGGIGAIKLVLPKNVGVRVKVSGLGSIDKNDLMKKNGYYVNDQYGKSASQIDVEVSGGLGSLEMILQ